jgi:DNA-binding PadR family transcriptional regulator
MEKRSHHSGAHSPEYALLGFLYEQPNHGYNLHRLLVGELSYIWHVSQSQTYNILNRLESRGYISSSTQEQEKLPPRQLLQLTDSGRYYFEDWLRAPSGSSVRAIRVELITRLYFAQKYFPALIQPILTAQSEEMKLTILRLETNRKSIPVDQAFNLLSLELRIRELRSVRDWLVQCHKTLEKDLQR